MVSPVSNDPFRFFDLPAELRNAVYHLIFEDTAAHEVDLIAMPYYRSTAAITLTSRHIRDESFAIYKEAVTHFRKSHTFQLFIEGKANPNSPLEEIITSEFKRKKAEVLKKAAVLRLSVHLYLQDYFFKLGIHQNDDGEVVLSCTLPPWTGHSQDGLARCEEVIARSSTELPLLGLSGVPASARMSLSMNDVIVLRQLFQCIADDSFNR